MAAYHVLNTDASKRNPSNPSSDAAIGVVLRQRVPKGRPLVVLAYVSKSVGALSVQEAEYRALIEGLKLAQQYDPTDLYAFVDSSFIARQLGAPAPKVKAKSIKPLYQEARELIDSFGGRITVSWVPREMNAEADQRAADALLQSTMKHK
jgi:ribonuclease HI